MSGRDTSFAVCREGNFTHCAAQNPDEQGMIRMKLLVVLPRHSATRDKNTKYVEGWVKIVFILYLLSHFLYTLKHHRSIFFFKAMDSLHNILGGGYTTLRD
jgi:hypothetical protein